MLPTSHEERFGLRVTLNSIGENRVRSIDKHTLDTIGRHTKVQASKEAAPSEFGLDIEQDLLRAITGTPNHEALGKTLSGLDALHAVVRMNLDSLRSVLSRYLAQFKEDTYKKTFPWVDQITDVRDAALKHQLDALMLAAVGKGRFDKCWLAVPEPIEWAQIVGFRYRRGRRHAILHDIGFETFLEANEVEADDLTVDLLERREVSAVDPDDTTKYAWSVYRCIYCEVEHLGETYLLSGGHWYRVASDFVKQVNDFYRRVRRYEVELPEFGDETEGAYNERVARDNAATYALMDRQLISVGGGYSKVEFCDLFTRQNDLIHVKRYGGSGVLSHLFSQGVVSGQLLVSDAAFRRAVNALLPRSHRLPDVRNRPDAGTFQVVFAVVSSESGKELTLPFFSRLNVKNAVQLLEGYGYKVALAKIRVSDEVAKTKKFK